MYMCSVVYLGIFGYIWIYLDIFACTYAVLIYVCSVVYLDMFGYICGFDTYVQCHIFRYTYAVDVFVYTHVT